MAGQILIDANTQAISTAQATNVRWRVTPRRPASSGGATIKPAKSLNLPVSAPGTSPLPFSAWSFTTKTASAPHHKGSWKAARGSHRSRCPSITSVLGSNATRYQPLQASRPFSARCD